MASFRKVKHIKLNLSKRRAIGGHIVLVQESYESEQNLLSYDFQNKMFWSEKYYILW